MVFPHSLPTPPLHLDSLPGLKLGEENVWVDDTGWGEGREVACSPMGRQMSWSEKTLRVGAVSAEVWSGWVGGWVGGWVEADKGYCMRR